MLIQQPKGATHTENGTHLSKLKIKIGDGLYGGNNLFTYPISGLAPVRSWILAHVMVILFSVTLTTFGAPGGGGNVLGSGVRCRFGLLLLFSTCGE